MASANRLPPLAVQAVGGGGGGGGGGTGEANTSSNVGTGEGLAKAKSGLDLPFKTLVAGSGITLTPSTNELTIAASGVSGIVDGEAANFAALPSAASHSGELYVVYGSTGTFFLGTKKEAGIYRSDGASWTRLGAWENMFSDDVLTFSDDADPTKKAKFQLSGIGTGQTRLLTLQNKDITVADAADIPAYSDTNPLIAGTAAQGSSPKVSRQDHVHPPQTTVSGLAGSAAVLATPRAIQGVNFDGSAPIEIMSTATQAATAKGTPVDADVFSFFDSAASFILKKLTWSDVKGTLKTYYDTLYAATRSTVSQAEAEAGTATTVRDWTAERVKQAIAALGGGGGGGTKTYAILTPLDSHPTASNFATPDTRNGIPVLDFDDTTEESAVWLRIMVQGASLGSGLKVTIHWMATSATSGNVRWGVKIERMNAAGTDEDSDSFDTAVEAHTASDGTSGKIASTTITITTIDSLAAQEAYRILIYRDASDTTNDTVSGDAEFVAAEIWSAA